jgi:hypothetical protein
MAMSNAVRAPALHSRQPMLPRADVLRRTEECDRILSVCGDHIERIVGMLDLQFRLIHNRAQILLAMCGVLISTSVVLMTGKLLGRMDLAHQSLLATILAGAGIAEVVAAAIVIVGVLNVRWATQIPGDNLRAWILASLAYRDDKTRAYRRAISLVLVALLFYQIAATFSVVQA